MILIFKLIFNTKTVKIQR